MEWRMGTKKYEVKRSFKKKMELTAKTTKHRKQHGINNKTKPNNLQTQKPLAGNGWNVQNHGLLIIGQDKIVPFFWRAKKCLMYNPFWVKVRTWTTKIRSVEEEWTQWRTRVSNIRTSANFITSISNSTTLQKNKKSHFSPNFPTPKNSMVLFLLNPNPRIHFSVVLFSILERFLVEIPYKNFRSHFSPNFNYPTFPKPADVDSHPNCEWVCGRKSNVQHHVWS